MTLVNIGIGIIIAVLFYFIGKRAGGSLQSYFNGLKDGRGQIEREVLQQVQSREAEIQQLRSQNKMLYAEKERLRIVSLNVRATIQEAVEGIIDELELLEPLEQPTPPSTTTDDSTGAEIDET